MGENDAACILRCTYCNTTCKSWKNGSKLQNFKYPPTNQSKLIETNPKLVNTKDRRMLLSEHWRNLY